MFALQHSGTRLQRECRQTVIDHRLREIREHHAGKVTLHTVHVEPRPLPQLTPDAIRDIRNRLDIFRAVFAHMIRVPVRTVERWEQRRSSPPDSAAALVLMAQKYHDTFERLASL